MSSRRKQPGRKFDIDMALSMEELAQRIQSARQRTGKTQAEIADEAGVSLRQYSRYENAKGLPRATQVPALAQALGVPVEHLDEPQQQTVLERLERQMTDTAALTRSALGLLDQLLLEVRENRETVKAATLQLSSRLELLETRADTQQAQFSPAVLEFLRSLGAPVPPPATDAPGQAKTRRPTPTEGSSP